MNVKPRPRIRRTANNEKTDHLLELQDLEAPAGKKEHMSLAKVLLKGPALFEEIRESH